MRLFAIFAPRTVEAVAGPEGARAARTGFSFAGLVFGPLWLLFRGLFLALFIYAAAAAAVVALVRFGVLRPSAALGLGALGHLYVAIEGRALALSTRIRSGRALVDLIFARSALEAEKIYLERALAAAPAAAPRGAPPASPEVIGLFPEPGR
jgi:hypothetical protein